MVQQINLRQEWPEQHRALEDHILYRKVDRVLRRLPPGNVLEIGCLDERYLSILRRRGWRVAGVELQPQPLDFIIEHDAGEPLPFGPEFDVVIAVEVIEHVVDTDQFLQHCARVLKPGGLLILTTPNLLFLVNRLVMAFGKAPFFAYADFHVRMFVWDDLRSKIARRFAIEGVKGSHVLLGRRARPAVVSRIFSLLGDRFPRLAAHLIVVARLPAPDHGH